MGANALGIIEGSALTVTANAAIAEFLRVTMASTGKVGIAGLTDPGEGIAMQAFAADGSVGVMRDIDAEGTQYGVASEAIAIGDTVYTAASGKISKTATATGFLLGKAYSAAAADGDKFVWKRRTPGAANA